MAKGCDLASGQITYSSHIDNYTSIAAGLFLIKHSKKLEAHTQPTGKFEIDHEQNRYICCQNNGS